jgi:D-alanyl-D-alanine carboxypeptidase/D-alanyl-D-alanine-endopeptidase (penicillin-binding protein 4)
LELASVVNKRSHNHYAEHVFKMAAALYGGAGAGADQGKAALLAALDSLDVQRQGAIFHDGSGLSRRNRVSARTHVDMLCAIARQPYFNDFYSSLAIAGVDGSLRRRMIGTPAHDNLRGKTGTLRNVSSLGGYVTTGDGELLAFSILSNGPRTGSYKSTENAAGSILAAFTYAPAEEATDVSNPAPDPESDPESDVEEEQQEPHADVEE